MKLVGINIRNFRSIGSQGVEIVPLHKCNILIGQNNVGKSNALRAIQRILNNLNPSSTGEGAKQLEIIDYNRQDQSRIPEFILYFSLDKTIDKDLFDAYGDTSVFFDFIWNSQFQIRSYSFSQITDFGKANGLLNLTTGRHWSNRIAPEHIQREFLNHADLIFSKYFQQYIPLVVFIPEFRRIEANTSYLFHGSGIPEQMSKWQHPSVLRSKDREKFDKVQYFVRQLLHMTKAELEVDTSNTIILNNGISRLALECVMHF